MVFSSIQIRTPIFYLLFFLVNVTLAVIAAEPPVLSLSDNELNPDQPKIDWSKPVVSRGFGLEESVIKTDEAELRQYQSGQVFYFFGDYKKAIEKWMPLLKSNIPEVQASMGWIYQAGLGVEKDEKKAFQLYMKAASQQNAIAQNNLAVMYENGISIDKDLTQARYWYQQSAEKGYRFGQYNYARLLLKETMTADSLSQAKLLLTKASEQGVAQATEKLSTLPK